MQHNNYPIWLFMFMMSFFFIFLHWIHFNFYFRDVVQWFAECAMFEIPLCWVIVGQLSSELFWFVWILEFPISTHFLESLVSCDEYCLGVRLWLLRDEKSKKKKGKLGKPENRKTIEIIRKSSSQKAFKKEKALHLPCLDST